MIRFDSIEDKGEVFGGHDCQLRYSAHLFIAECHYPVNYTRVNRHGSKLHRKRPGCCSPPPTMSAQDEETNPYDLLGVKTESTEQEIRTAYRQRSLKVHPDRVCAYTHLSRQRSNTSRPRTQTIPMQVREEITSTSTRLTAATASAQVPRAQPGV